MNIEESYMTMYLNESLHLHRIKQIKFRKVIPRNGGESTDNTVHFVFSVFEFMLRLTQRVG